MIAIDPGTLESAVVEWDGAKVGICAILPNHDVLDYLLARWGKRDVVIERIANFGKPMADSTIQTIMWIGRFIQAHKCAPDRSLIKPPVTSLIFRKTVVAHVCGTVRAGDAEVKAAMEARFGEKKGSNQVTGKLKADLWQAFALAVTAHDKGEFVLAGRV